MPDEDDGAERSDDELEACSWCSGVGVIGPEDERVTCPACRGTGKRDH